MDEKEKKNPFKALIEKGKATGKLTTQEIDMAILETNIEVEALDKLYETLEAENIEKQKEVLNAFLPEMLSQEKIKEIILSLPDKSIPTVMKHFKANYAGKVDMKDVNIVLKSL